MAKVVLGLGTNIDRQRSLRAGLAALRQLDAKMIVSSIYESDAVGFDGAPFYNCVVQLHSELALAKLVSELKAIENANGRNRAVQSGEGKGLDIDVLLYDDLQGCFEGVELPRADITRYAHVLLPLAEIAPADCLPGTTTSFKTLWDNFDAAEQRLAIVDDF